MGTSLFTLPAATSTIAGIQAYADPYLTALLGIGLLLVGIVVGALVVAAVAGAIMRAVMKLTGRGRGGKGRRRR
jgi:hypothetical protein